MKERIYIADKETLDQVNEKIDSTNKGVESANDGIAQIMECERKADGRLAEIKDGMSEIANAVGGGIGGGIAPSNMRELFVYPSDGGVKVRFLEPADTVVDGQTLCTYKGTKIIIKEGSYPEDESDGTEILDCREPGKYQKDLFVYEGLTNGKTYYAQAFPYSDHGVCNRNRANARKFAPNKCSVVTITYSAKEAIGCEIVAKLGDNEKKAVINGDGTAQLELDSVGEWIVGGQKVAIDELGQTVDFDEKMYGYDWTLDEADTESSISYPDGVDNAAFEPVPARGADGAIELGDWQEFHDWVGCRPVMLSFDGAVAYELNHDDQTLRLDGEKSGISDAGQSANAMVEFPKRYFKRWTSGTGEFEVPKAHFRVSRFKLGDDWKCYPWMYGATEDDAAENDRIYLPMHEGSYLSGKVRTLADQTPMNAQTGAVESAGVSALGEGWIFDDWQDECMIADYMFMMGRSTDVGKHWGNGHCDGGTAASSLHKTGLLKSCGPYYGGTGNSNMKFMWLENYYGDRWTRSAGVWYLANILWVKNFPPYAIDPTQVTEANGWKSLGRGITGTTGGYISEVTYDENGMIPKTVSGSQTTYVPDGCWFANGQMFLLWGGACGDGLRCGAAFAVDDPFSYSAWLVGPSPAYKKPSEA